MSMVKTKVKPGKSEAEIIAKSSLGINFVFFRFLIAYQNRNNIY